MTRDFVDLKTGQTCTFDLDTALSIVRAAGYRVTKPRAPAPAAPVRTLNALGKPFGAGYSPNYRMKYRTPLVSVAPMPKSVREHFYGNKKYSCDT